jgi:hypothetical protein
MKRPFGLFCKLFLPGTIQVHNTFFKIKVIKNRIMKLNFSFFFLPVLFCFTSIFAGNAIAGNNLAGYNVLSFGARPDGVTDNTECFQKALDKAAETGSAVLVPAGKYLIKGSLLLNAVALVGENQAVRAPGPLNGTVIMSTGGRDNENAPSLFEMRGSSSVMGITVYYPDQLPDDVHPYPWTFHIGSENLQEEVFDCTIEDITLINSFNGIYAGPCENGRHTIHNVYGTVLHRGIFVESVGDVGRISEIHFHCVYWKDAETKGDFWKVFHYMQENLVAFTIGRSDWEYITNTFVFPAKLGYWFKKTIADEQWTGSPNGQFSGIGCDASGCCIRVDQIQRMGLLITNGQFNSHLTGDSTQVVIGDSCEGSVRFVNCGFWGPVKHNALINGNGYISFTDCYFSNNYYDSAFYSIEANSGRLQVNNCTFDALQSEKSKEGQWNYQGEKTAPPSVHIGKGIRHAVVSGNNGFYGVAIKNEIGSNAYIEGNEPYKK